MVKGGCGQRRAGAVDDRDCRDLAPERLRHREYVAELAGRGDANNGIIVTERRLVMTELARSRRHDDRLARAGMAPMDERRGER